MDQRLLDDAKRMTLAWHGRTGPVLAPMAFWWDGRHLWCSTSGSSAKVERIEDRPEVAVLVGADDDGASGAVLRGRARIFRPTDVVAMATHGATLAAAQAALAVKQAPSIAGYVVDAARIPSRWMPARRVMLRITVDDPEPILAPTMGPGIAPGLPTAVPPEVRRLLSGQRRVVLGVRDGEHLRVLPAIWGPGFTLDLPAGESVPTGLPAVVVTDHDPGFRPTEVAGVAVRGRISGRTISAESVRWWHGFDSGRAEMPTAAFDPIVLPD
ncbi:pyridoxamine 5'-phosphate oxidase family protein [Euzebya rosea]|uniref:pyridoxamine 5'-phosphate oxidase family protein n=1 Tax=Euzebya rosea TaxID=2052804 RepID=UPI0013008DAB|nr:pyridoxamine 5'-phosphate oxidase family protein [Euzebya rosea]